MAVKGPRDADTQQDIDAHASKVCGVTKSEASIYMNGKGFMKVRRDTDFKRTVYFYQYAFTVEGKKQKPQFVKIAQTATK